METDIPPGLAVLSPLMRGANQAIVEQAAALLLLDLRIAALKIGMHPRFAPEARIEDA